MLLIYQNVSNVPFLGPWGQVLLLILAATLATLSWRQRQWQTTAKAAGAALDVAITELQTWKDRGERLGKENRELLQNLATLQARTDLQPIVDALNAWTIEGRGQYLTVIQRLEAIHTEQTAAMVAVTLNLTKLAQHLAALEEARANANGK